ncbi:hypothetical protein [Phytohabitans suffuscus]|uniref:hypothetical protein n=1 Tax=Phytohabitans suffuscus TaxID=624315 RepID=UPI001567B0EF|nr:hypothetical protein [Phytohabitans suffuscus]
MYTFQPASSASERNPSKDDTAAEAADTLMPTATTQSRLAVVIFEQTEVAVLHQLPIVVQPFAPFAVQFTGQRPVFLIAGAALEVVTPPFSI